MASHDWRVEPVAEKTKVCFVLARAKQNHPLTKADANARRKLGSDSKVCSLATVNEVAVSRFGASDALLIGFVRYTPSLFHAEDSRPDILGADDKWPVVCQNRSRVWTIKNPVANLVEPLPSPVLGKRICS